MLIRALAASLLLLAVTFAYATAQEPTPEPTPEYPRCLEVAGMPGGRTIDVGKGVQVSIPAGHYQQIVVPPNLPYFTLCHVETQALVTMSYTTCQEVSRRAATPEANAVVDQIVSSCRVLPPPTPVVISFSCMDGDTVAGGQTVTIENSIQVTLPEGDFVVTLLGEDVAFFCNLDAQYDIGIRLSDCGQATISSPLIDPAIIKGIVDSCRLLHPVTPQPAGATIRPPNTGSAGLVSR